MHILVFHQYYLFPGAPGGSRFNEFARLWASFGHKVTVVAGTLNYATGKVPDAYVGRFLTRETDGPVSVVRAWVPSTYSSGYAGRAAAFGGFSAAATAAIALVDRPDVVIATSPPLPISAPGWLAAKRFGVPFVFEVRDLWPESAITTGVLDGGSALARGLYGLERQAYAQADRINVLTPAFRKDIVARGLASEEKIWFVPNGADTEAFTPGPAKPELRRELGWGDRFVAMYAGAHGRANALGQLVEAAELLRHDPRILIASVGDGPERTQLESEVAKRNLTNIRFHGAFPKERMPDLVRACDVGLAVLQNNPTFRTVYPNKVFDYMACERATVLAIDGVARQMVCDEAGAGVFVPPEVPTELARTLRELANAPSSLEAMGKRGATWVHANVRREALAQRYAEHLETLIRERKVS
jgi:glycosyltransferase involved in cell wall biosynthesis